MLPSASRFRAVTIVTRCAGKTDFHCVPSVCVSVSLYGYFPVPSDIFRLLGKIMRVLLFCKKTPRICTELHTRPRTDGYPVVFYPENPSCSIEVQPEEVKILLLVSTVNLKRRGFSENNHIYPTSKPYPAASHLLPTVCRRRTPWRHRRPPRLSMPAWFFVRRIGKIWDEFFKFLYVKWSTVSVMMWP